LPPTRGRTDRVAAELEDQAAKWLVAASQRKSAGTEDAMTVQLLNGLLQKSQMTPAQFARLIASPQKIMIELERSRQLALGSQREALALAKQAEETAKTGGTFRLACQKVGGSLAENPEGLVCDWQHAVGDPRPRAFGEADALAAQQKGEVAAAEEAFKKRDQYIANAPVLQEKYVRASELGKIVTRLLVSI